jgi:predicted acyltransferase
MTTDTDAKTGTDTRRTPTDRLLSIDALRGFDMFWIVGGDKLARALGDLAGTPAGKQFGDQFRHVRWEGFRFYDLIFPLFVFLVGVVIPFSQAKDQERGGQGVYLRIARRTALLFIMGLIYYHALDLEPGRFRMMGVLQRIALSYGVAALIAWNLSTRGVVVLVAAILLGYWGLLAGVAAPGGKAGDYSRDGNLPGWVDRQTLPNMGPGSWGDPEGLLSTVPAVATALLGVLAGRWLRSGRGPWEKVAGLAGAGVACTAAGLAWWPVFPVIKSLWTSSYVLLAGGLSLLLLALFYAVIDVLGFRRWAFFFAVIGANAITIYVSQRFINFDYTARFFLGGVYRLAGLHVSPGFQHVLELAGVIVVEWLFLWFLYRKRIFLRV